MGKDGHQAYTAERTAAAIRVFVLGGGEVFRFARGSLDTGPMHPGWSERTLKGELRKTKRTYKARHWTPRIQ